MTDPEGVTPASDANGSPPPEVERLLNPAFGAAVLTRAAAAYASKRDAEGLPIVLAFLVLPVVLHSSSRDAVNAHNAPFGLHRFVRAHPEALAGLDRRVNGYGSLTRASLLLGHAQGMVQLDPTAAAILAHERHVSSFTASHFTADAAALIRAADRLGAWLAGTSVGQAFLLLQLTP